MQIAELGEFALIDRLNEGVSPVNAATLTAAGDDCAVMAYPATRVLATKASISTSSTPPSATSATRPRWPG